MLKMKKVVNFLIIVALICMIALPISVIALNSEIAVGDELWNFQNVMKIVNGNKLYVDANAIVTPIFYLLGALFLKVFSANILGFRIYNIFTFLYLILSIFLIFKSLKIEKIKSVLYTLLTFLFIMPYISNGASYNVIAVSLYLTRNKSILK